MKKTIKFCALALSCIAIGYFAVAGYQRVASYFIEIKNEPPVIVHLSNAVAPERQKVSGILNLYVVRGGRTIAHYGPFRNTVTTAGKNYVVDAWQNSVELETMKYHGIGTGTTAANAADTALETELTTQYNPNSTRATGSLTEGASANIFRSVGTNTVDASVAITEWGLLTQAATGGGVLFSRVVFSAINLTSGDSLQTTYDLTVN